jgi:hypothetical protein
MRSPNPNVMHSVTPHPRAAHLPGAAARVRSGVQVEAARPIRIARGLEISQLALKKKNATHHW